MHDPIDVINSFPEDILEIIPRGYLPGKKKSRVIRIIEPDEDKWDAAFYFINRCTGLLKRRYFEPYSKQYDAEKISGVGYTFGCYPDYYTKELVENGLKRELGDEKIVNDLLALLVNKEVTVLELKDKLGAYDLDHEKIVAVLGLMSDAYLKIEVMQIYLFTATRVGIIQREPESLLVGTYDKSPEGKVIVAPGIVKDGQRISGEVTERRGVDGTDCKWWYEDGRETNPEQFLEEFIEKLQAP